MLSGDNICHEARPDGCLRKESLCSDQEEADTKVVLHALYALSNDDGNVVIRSPSDDTDIFIIALGIVDDKSCIKFDYGNGTNRKALLLDEIDIDRDHCDALIGFHAFTGNDCVSAFFRKGKSLCWKTMIKKNEYLDWFKALGDQCDLSLDFKATLEKYVCSLYSPQENQVKEVKADLHETKKFARHEFFRGEIIRCERI